MFKIRLILFAALCLSFSTFLYAQNPEEETEKRIERETKLVEGLLTDADSLKLPENRAVVFSQIGGYFCKSNKAEAIRNFQKSVNDLIRAQQEAEKIKKNAYTVDQLIYGQNPRFTILQTIAACDAELALDALYKSRPARVSQAIAQAAQNPKSPSAKLYYVNSELQTEQRFIGLAAEKNPARAVKLLRESIKNGITYETLNLLRKIYENDAKTAEKLAEEVVEKLLGETLSTTDYQTSATIQYFLSELGREKTREQEKSLEISDALLKNLADKISAFWLENNTYSYSVQTEGFKVIEKYFPARAARIKQKQAQTGNREYDDYNKLMQADASPEELLSQAEKFQNYRTSIYSSAAQKLAQGGNVSKAVNIIKSKFSETEAEQQISNLYNNLAYEEISKGNYQQANFYINQIPNDQYRFNALTNLARSVYQQNAEENKSLALSILDQAYAIIDTPEITQQEITNLVEIANVYARIEPSEAFRAIESIVPAMNEFTRAFAVVSQFRNEPVQRSGEFFIANNASMTGAYNLGNSLQVLKDKDFDRAMRLINSFERAETRIALKLDIIRSFSNLSENTGFFTSEKKGER